ncbi:hypothetical protein TWF481_007806 [Arthrobotrys musiformis]|uniref:Uncharacterized protein n=1 Tax=Arthrobotrys musiformis TaxID=47236 RepID=A0AAV9W592_9PEZI
MPPAPNPQGRGSRWWSASQPSAEADTKCHAFHKDGTDCWEDVNFPGDKYCLRKSYKLAEAKYDAVEIEEGESDIQKIIKKLAAGREAVRLRDQANRRFYGLSEDNSGHNRWILKLQNSIQKLEQSPELVQWRLDLGRRRANDQKPIPARSLLQTGPKLAAEVIVLEQGRTILPRRSLHQPNPIAEVFLFNSVKSNGLEPRRPILKKIYDLAPSLKAHPTSTTGETSEMGERSPRDDILRFFLREIILHRGDPSEISRAVKCQNISAFLRSSSNAELDSYVTIFEAFKGLKLLRNSMPNSLQIEIMHCLRDAICDYISDSQPPPSPIYIKPTLSILGANIILEGTYPHRRMGIRFWDCLWTNFECEVQGEYLDIFAVRFRDLIQVKVLAALSRYRSWCPDYPRPGPYREPSIQYLSLHRALVMQRFVPMAEGIYDYDESLKFKTAGCELTNTEKRCYILGRVSLSSGMSYRLEQKLTRMVGNIIVLIFDSEKGYDVPMSHTSGEPVPWIIRNRTVQVGSPPCLGPWTTVLDAKSVFLQDDCRLKKLQNRSLAKDYLDFLIIDRDPWRGFQILREVAETICELCGKLSYHQLAHEAIQNYIPSHETTLDFNDEESIHYLDEFSLQDAIDFQGEPMLRFSYVENRSRCWDTTGSFRDTLETRAQYTKQQITGRLESHSISGILSDLEAHQVITPILEYEVLDTNSPPIVVKGSDGFDDLYFCYTYDMYPKYEQEVLRYTVRRRKGLFEFAKAYKRSHPGGVFAKGRIKVPYCAWPLPTSELPGLESLKFSTRQGCIYKWNLVPFDLPGASRAWQHFIDQEINDLLPFVCIVDTTVLLNLDSLWEGVRPALEGAIFAGTDRYRSGEIDESGDMPPPEPEWMAYARGELGATDSEAPDTDEIESDLDRAIARYLSSH